jgi:hypothetical protein
MWLLKNLGLDDAVVGDLVEQNQAGRPTTWLWRQVLAAACVGARRQAFVTVGAVGLGWIFLWVYGVTLVRFDLLIKTPVERYSAEWWLRSALMWIEVGFPFVASGWMVAKLAWRTPLLPLLTFAVSVSTVVLIVLVLDTGPAEGFDLQVWLTVPLFLIVAPATAIAAGGLVAARR